MAGEQGKRFFQFAQAGQRQLDHLQKTFEERQTVLIQAVAGKGITALVLSLGNDKGYAQGDAVIAAGDDFGLFQNGIVAADRQVPAAGLGAGRGKIIIKGGNDDALSVKAIETAVEQGITWIDTAPIYGLYHSEEVVGEALRHIDRDKVILSTKCGLEWRHESPVLHKVVDGVQTYRDLSAKSIIEDVEDSLRRLGTDHLDVLYTHWQTPDLSIFPLEETVEAMMKLKEQGKIRAIGASNTTAEFIRGYCKYGQLDVIQEKYSLLTRRIEKQLLPTCKELGVSIQAYSPLEQGLLTGKVTMDTTYPEGSTRNTNPCFQPARRAQAIRLLDSWSDLCEKYHCTKAQLVIALTARMIPGLHVLCGARTPEQAIDNAGALHIALEGADAVQMKWDVDAIS